MEVTILMKKISFFCFVSYLYTDFSCVWKKAAPITLPQADKITSIDITIEETQQVIQIKLG